MSPFTRLFVYAVIIADLFAIIFFGGTAILHGTILPEEAHAKIIVPGAEVAETAGTSAAAAAPAFDLASYVADPIKGQQVSGKCKACHTFEQGGPNRTGPNLWGVDGRAVAAHEGFSYSSAMVDHGKEIGGKWSDESLRSYLESPKTVVPGTKMQYNGVKDPKEREDLIAWLKTLK